MSWALGYAYSYLDLVDEREHEVGAGVGLLSKKRRLTVNLPLRVSQVDFLLLNKFGQPLLKEEILIASVRDPVNEGFPYDYGETGRLFVSETHRREACLVSETGMRPTRLV